MAKTPDIAEDCACAGENCGNRSSHLSGEGKEDVNASPSEFVAYWVMLALVAVATPGRARGGPRNCPRSCNPRDLALRHTLKRSREMVRF